MLSSQASSTITVLSAITSAARSAATRFASTPASSVEPPPAQQLQQACASSTATSKSTTMANCLNVSKLGLRLLQIVFALISFASAASLYNGWHLRTSYVQFMVFTGVMAFLIALFYAIVCCVEGLKRTFSGVVEVFVNALWVIFWLAAAGAFAAYVPCKPSQISTSTFTRCDVFLASEAFAWLSWFLWIGSLAIAVVEMRRGEGMTGGAKRYPQSLNPGV